MIVIVSVTKVYVQINIYRFFPLFITNFSNSYDPSEIKFIGSDTMLKQKW